MPAAMHLLLGAALLALALCQSTQPRTAFVTYTFPTLNLTGPDLDIFRSELYIALTSGNPPLVMPNAVREIIIDGTTVDVGVDMTELANDLFQATSTGFCISVDELTFCGLPLGATTPSPVSFTSSDAAAFIVQTTLPPRLSATKQSALSSTEIVVVAIVCVSQVASVRINPVWEPFHLATLRLLRMLCPRLMSPSLFRL